MPSNKEILYQDHICAFLEKEHKHKVLSKDDCNDKDYHIIEATSKNSFSSLTA